MTYILLWIGLFIGGFLIIFFAADIFIDNLKDICIEYNISPFIIGLLVLGIDPEESIASIVAAMNDLPLIAVGNVIGNSIFSLTLCFAVPTLFYRIEFKKVSQFYFMILYVIMVLILLSFLIYMGLFIFGILLILIYLIYLFMNLKRLKKEGYLDVVDMKIVKKEIEETREKVKNTSKSLKLVLICVSFLLIFIGGEILIFATEQLIILLNIPEAFFGFVIIAFVTNVEELTLIFKAIQKERIEIGLGAMVGKIIWNLSFTFGVSGIILMNIEFVWLLFWNWLILMGLIIYFHWISKKKFLDKKDGIFLILILIVFITVNLYVLNF